GDDVYVERDGLELVRLGDSAGAADAERPVLPGRPSRDGKALVMASVTDGVHGSVALASLDRATQDKRFAREVAFGMPVLKLLLVDTDQTGVIYLAALGERLPE